MKQILILLVLLIVGYFGYQYFAEGKTDFPKVSEIEDLLPNRPAGDAASLENSTWHVTAIGSEVVRDAGITANFTNGTLSGKDGCNQYSTTYALDGASINIDAQIASTLMACPEATMVLAGLYTQTLSLVTKYQVEGDTLTLLNSKDVGVITLQKQTVGLADTAWKVTGYNNGAGVVTSPIDQTEMTFAFVDESQFQASSCNSVGGTYKLGENNSMIIRDLLSTGIACISPEGAMEQESQFTAALAKVARYERNLNNIILLDAQGNTQITAEIMLAL